MPGPTIFDVSNIDELNADIELIDAAKIGSYELDFLSSGAPASITLAEHAISTPLEAIDLQSGVSLTIDGEGQALDGVGQQRGLFVYAGQVTIENLTIQNMTAVGGAGGFGGGGGGAGLGGGLFVGANVSGDTGGVTLDNVSFANDSATGGVGGDSGAKGASGAGGGGGMGGAGGNAKVGVDGGGGGGGIGVGAAGAAGKNKGAPGLIPGGAGGGSGGGGGGGASGGGGGGGAGGGGSSGGGGGGVGGGAGGGIGGGGGYGGGGGGSGLNGDGGNAGFGGGGGGSNSHGEGGSGGFGGGGGGGGGAGYGGGAGGAGGFGGGGGGLGAGGDIFVQQGASLSIVAGTMAEGAATGGVGVGGGRNGGGYGAGIFLQGDETITLGAGGAAGSVTTIQGDIADESGNDGGSATPGAGSINIAGDGTVIFEGAASYTGTTNIEPGATLQVGTGGAGGAVNHSGALNVAGDMIVDNSTEISTSATLSGAGEIVKAGSGELLLKGAGGGFSGEAELQSGLMYLSASDALGSGFVRFDGPATLVLNVSSLADSAIENFQDDDVMAIKGLGAYAPAAPHIALPTSFMLSLSGDTVTQINSDGSKEVTAYDITGQSFTTKVLDYDQKGLIVAKYYENVTGQGNLSAFEYLYGGNNLIGTDNFYSGITGKPYTAEETDYDGDSRLTRAVYSDVSGEPYSSFEYDYVGGVFSGSNFTYTTVPSGATYSSYQVDYDWANAYAGETFFFTDVTGQSYTGEEEDFDSNTKLSRVVLTGVTGQAYYQLEEDYDAGVYAGYKAYYLISGQPYTNEEVDVSASNQIEKVVYSGMTSTPYSSVEEDYSGGSVSTIIYGYSDVTGQTYYAYDVGDNSGGAGEQETFDLNTGGHNLVALTSGQTLTSLGLDKMTGDGAATFVLDAIYGADVITNFNSADKVSLPMQEYAVLSSAIQHGSYSGGNATLSFGDGDTLTFKNMTQATLQSLSGSFTSHN